MVSIHVRAFPYETKHCQMFPIKTCGTNEIPSNFWQEQNIRHLIVIGNKTYAFSGPISPGFPSSRDGLVR